MRTLDLVLTAAAACALAGTAAPPSPPGQNLLQNPSFEDRSGPRQPDEKWGTGFLDGVSRSPFAHWGYGGFWDGGDYDIKLGKGRTGNLCARLVCRTKGRGGICSEVIMAAPGTRLRFSGYFKAVGARGGACFVNFEGTPGDGWARIALPDKPDYDWQEVTGEVTVPTPKKAAGDKVEILVFIYTKAYGELWIDDVSLTVVQP